MLAVGDSALRFWKAVREVFLTTKEQLGWFHYADVRIMPAWVASALVVGPGGLRGADEDRDVVEVGHQRSL